MKKNIHPKANTIEVKFTNGSIVKMISAFSNRPKITLEVDTHNHPAWTGKLSIIGTNNNIKSFRNKFKGIEL